MDEQYVWALNSAPWYASKTAYALEGAIAVRSCWLELEGVEQPHLELEFFRDQEYCRGFRVHGIEQAGSYRFLCDSEIGDEFIDEGEFVFEVGKEVVFDDSYIEGLETGKREVECAYDGEDCTFEEVFFEPIGLSGDFFAIGGLVQAYVGYDVWSGTVCTQEREHWATKEDYCRDYTLEVQAIAHDGSDAGFATADIVCEDWFGCAAAPRGASVAALTLALLGLGVRRRRAPGRGPWG